MTDEANPPQLSNYSSNPITILPQADFNFDTQINQIDIDLLQQAIMQASDDPHFDLNETDVIDKEDTNYLINTILNTNYGDADLDQIVNLVDLAILAEHFGQSNTSWAQGDFNGDNTTNLIDLALLAEHFGKDQTQNGSASSSPVTQPATQPSQQTEAFLINTPATLNNNQPISWDHINNLLDTNENLELV